ncbi:hypothetical protein RJ640_022808 [Escallonia rubra]|uniref:DNA-3-methyladenine glycosylase I n=1 Tax=Escallonia rubra TaxID=112253 RepID=A0AA88UNU2_9ASTE|nr:hypothetical protein RJ640_022808 [Escallonia rubra]
MCSSKSKLMQQGSSVDMTPISHINGRPVLQPTCNRVPLLERRNSLKKTASLKSPLPSPQITAAAAATPAVVSPKLKSPRQPAIKRGNDPNGLNSSVEKVVLTPPRCSNNTGKSAGITTSVKKSKKCTSNGIDTTTLNYSATSIVEAPGSIAAARREQVAEMQVQRKMKIAHYGRTKSSKFEGKVASVLDSSVAATANVREEKRCSFITPNSDPIYVAYHDEEWGVPAHDDKLLFELLVLTGAQVGSDWTSVLKKRHAFRDAFSGFDAEIVSKLSEKKITSISAEYGIEISQVRGVVDNSKSILEIKKEFGSFDKYLWGFVNHKVISTQYKSCNKIPVKTSKSESISKDMVRRGFRQVGPTVIHSFMQAAGLTNDHLMTCTRHLQCTALASQRPTVAPAL